MILKLSRVVVAALFLLSVAAHAEGADPGLNPNHSITPGAINPDITQSNVEDTICRVGYTKDVRYVSKATKRDVFEKYGLDYDTQSGDFEVDHFVSLELGGLNDITNLWPQRYEPRPGARQKDVVETALKRRICKGEITLKEAQKIIKTDWYAEYLRIQSHKKSKRRITAEDAESAE